MRELLAGLVTLIIILAALLGFTAYQRAEDRKAYYACLQLSEKLAEQQKQSDGGIRIVSLPYCRQ